MATTIVPAKVSPILPLEVFSIDRGGRNTLALPSGKIASDIELLGYDERHRIARYELRVANESASTLACYTYASPDTPGKRPVTCASLAVLPYSGVSVTFELPLPYIGNYERITVEMHGDGINLSSDTVPPGRNYVILIRRAMLCAVAAFATIITAIIGLFQPHILAVSAPSAVIGGSHVKVAYETHGLGTLEYSLSAADGSIVAAGTTTRRDGSIAFLFPHVAASRAYIVSIEEHNMFGGDVRTAVIKDLAPPLPRTLMRVEHPAAIQSLALERSHVQSGNKIRIHYSYTAKSGMLRLIDNNDAVWAAAPIDAGEIATFNAPHVDEPREMRVALHVEKSTTSADSEVGLTIVPAPAPAVHFKPIPGAPVAMMMQPLVAGKPILLRVTRNVADLHIALQDPHGTEIEGYNVDSEQAILHAPGDSEGKAFTLLITFADRNGQETIVYPIKIQKKTSESAT